MTKIIEKLPVKETELKNYYALVGHKLDVALHGTEEIERWEKKGGRLSVATPPLYAKKAVRVQYKTVPLEGKPDFVYDIQTIGLTNLPRKIPRTNFIVSRYTLMAIDRENLKLEVRQKLDEISNVLKELQEPVNEEEREALTQKAEKSVEAIRELMGEPILKEPRKDFLCPGMAVNAQDGTILFSRGLINAIR
jgi:hypothetical protein